jgi:hypothetical protein
MIAVRDGDNCQASIHKLCCLKWQLFGAFGALKSCRVSFTIQSCPRSLRGKAMIASFDINQRRVRPTSRDDFEFGRREGGMTHIPLSVTAMSAFSRRFAMGYAVGHAQMQAIWGSCQDTDAQIAEELARDYGLPFALIAEHFDYIDESTTLEFFVETIEIED